MTSRALALLAAVASGQDVAMRTENLRADLEFLCSDRLQGRLSLHRGADLAAKYIAAEFRKAGLKPAGDKSFLQRFPVAAYEPDRSQTVLRMTTGGTSESFQYGSHFRGGSPREASLQASVVFAGYGISAPEYHYDDYANVDVSGKIVLIFDHEPQERDARSIFNGTGHTRHGVRWSKALTAEKHGAAGVLLASEPRRDHVSAFDPPPKTAGGRAERASAPLQALDGYGPHIPLFSVNDEVAAKLLKSAGKTPGELQESIDRQLAPVSMALPGVVVEMRVVNRKGDLRLSANVAGLIEGANGSLRNETVLVTAHYDHLGVVKGKVYPGANDNASGTAAVMELARMFSHSSAPPKRSLLFVVFGSEEEGLLGSYLYTEKPLRPLATTRAVLNLDMIGRDEAHIPQSEEVVDIPLDTSNEVNLVAGFYSPDLETLIRTENERVGLHISTKFDRDHSMNALFRCDHFPFLLRNVPAIWFFGGWHPGYHEPSDTVEKINFVKLEKIVRLAYFSARALADGGEPPRFRP